MNTMQRCSTKVTLGISLALGGFALAHQQPQVHADTLNNQTQTNANTSTQSSAQNTASTYMVKSGDTLSAIAQNNNTTVAALESANGLSNDTVYAGQTLQLGGSQNTADSNGTYTVQAGDTLSAIAAANHTTVDTLMANNNLTSDTIMVGQVLQVSSSQSLSTDASNQTPAPMVSTGTTNYPSSVQASAPTRTTTTNTTTTQASQPVQATTNTTSASTSNQSSNDGSTNRDAKAWIANRESGGSYTSQNGMYYGKYQLSSSYLGGDYSPQHQEQVADRYVSNRYGSWENAKSFWQTHGWY